MQAELTLSPVSPIEARVERVFEAMSRIIDAPDSRLQHYRADFYSHDRTYLSRTRATGTYGWIVRESGTHLVQLGHHPKMHDELDAALALTRDLDCYLVDAGRQSVTHVDATALRARMARLQYTVVGAGVWRGEQRIASLDVQITPWAYGEAQKGIVSIASTGPSLGLEDLVALVQIAECEVIRKSQSLFTPVRSVTLDASDLYERIAACTA
ncbi:hypothetical protein [Burkholderia contaminans]|uniref:hypothetical protein n=1 Tax=Burkholderia contaminans TaxID=488447 RepID=UPI003D67E07E